MISIVTSPIGVAVSRTVAVDLSSGWKSTFNRLTSLTDRFGAPPVDLLKNSER